MNSIKKGDTVTIEGLNISPDGKMYSNKIKKRRKKPLPKLKVIKIFEGDTIDILLTEEKGH